MKQTPRPRNVLFLTQEDIVDPNRPIDVDNFRIGLDAAHMSELIVFITPEREIRFLKNRGSHADGMAFIRSIANAYQESQRMTPERFEAIAFPKVDCSHGAPMGRRSVGEEPTDGTKIYDRWLPMGDGYDKGGAYWGIPHNVRCRFTADGSFIKYYRRGAR